jgi:hypothetical protein
VQFQSSFAQISWICAAAFACAAVLAAAFIAGRRRPTPAPGSALIQTPVPHLACPVAFRRAPRQPANRTAARQATAPVSPVLLHLAAPRQTMPQEQA